MLYARPDLLHRVLAINAQAVAAYLNAQIDAGAQAVMIFDTWGGTLADGAFQEFSLAYLREVVAHLRTTADGEAVPSIVFTKGGGVWLDQIAAIGCTGVGLDWTVNLGAARARIGRQCALQGNLDPMTLFGGEAAIRDAARRVLDSFGRPRNADGSWDGHVFNLGHGISQHTPPDAVSILVETVHSHSRQLRL
jgi:uroporphyrinogen decarboxylase